LVFSHNRTSVDDEGRHEGLQEAVNRLIASGIPADQARRLLGLE
jgi:hypothetical protein